MRRSTRTDVPRSHVGAKVSPMDTEALRYTLEDAGTRSATAVIAMDDGKVNALSHTKIDALIALVSRAEKEAQALVLVGRPAQFCAGFDLAVMKSSPENATKIVRHGFELLLQLYASSIPVVIACTGHAVAAGALIVLAGDRRFGASGAFRIGLNEVAIGLPLPILAVELARDRLTPSELVRATLLAQLYAPDEAVRAGYLDAVVEPEELLPRARDEAARLATLSRAAYAATKSRLRHRTIAYLRETLDADMASVLLRPS
jgi:enoyl-CoA hydratase